jgi:DNA-binding response OmpR family regulator
MTAAKPVIITSVPQKYPFFEASSRVKRLRQKIEADPRKPALIKTVHGAGYVLAAADG